VFHFFTAFAFFSIKTLYLLPRTLRPARRAKKEDQKEIQIIEY
jgi:hypothetical protein